MAAKVIEDLKACGCDTDAALERFIGMEDMYVRFLGKFLDDPSFGEIKPHLDAGDEEAAFKSTHTLKGVAGNLGFTELFRIAADMVNRYRAGEQAAAWAHYDELEQEYNRIISIIRG